MTPRRQSTRFDSEQAEYTGFDSRQEEYTAFDFEQAQYTGFDSEQAEYIRFDSRQDHSIPGLTPGRPRVFPSQKSIQPRIQWALRILPRTKAVGRKADDPPPSSGEGKNAWGSTSTLLYVFVGRCLNKQGECFTSYVFA